MLKQFTWFVGFSAIFAVIAVMHGSNAVVAQAAPLSCGASDYVIEQPQILLSHDQGGAFIGPVAVSVPAGSYNLSTMSYEDHIGSNDPTQDNETWYFEGYNQSGDVVYTSPVTTDIPDDENYAFDDFGVVVIPELHAIRWVHNAYPDPSYQSVFPSCIQFQEVGAQAQTIDCQITYDLKGLSVVASTNLSAPINDLVYNFGDGTEITISASDVAAHTYQQAGTYTISVYDAADTSVNRTALCQTDVTVDAPGSVLGALVSGSDSDDPAQASSDTPSTPSVLGVTDGAVLAKTGVSTLVVSLIGLLIVLSPIGVAKSSSKR